MSEPNSITNSERAEVDITLLVCTYNRASDLRELLETALAQETGDSFTYEVLVVDNNSNDGTRDVVESFIDRGHNNLRYIFESKQGLNARLGLRDHRRRLHPSKRLG